MLEEEKKARPYKVVNPPHVHIGLDKNELMLKTFLLMSIIAYASVMVMGLQALFHILVALGTVLVVYNSVTAYQRWKGVKPTYDSPGSPLVAGMIVGLAMPLESPYLVTVVVAFMTMFVFKYIQGKYLDHKYLNPVATSKSIVLLALYGVATLNVFEGALQGGMLFHPHHYQHNMMGGFADMMGFFESAFVDTIPFFGIEISATQAHFFWQPHGWIGSGMGIVVLVVGSIAVYWLRYKWRIVVSTLGTMTILAIVAALVWQNGDISTADMITMRIAFHVFSGSILFMAFFMATEPQSTPMPEFSQFLFGVGLAVLTFVFQLNGFLGGSIIALVIMNMTTPLLDRIVIKKPYGHRVKSVVD